MCWRHPPSSQRKSGRATSCRGISFRNPGRWQRGLPVTIFLLLSQSPSQASWQSQLKELANRLLGGSEYKKGCKSIETRSMRLKVMRIPGSHRVERVCRVSKAPGVIVVSWLSYRESRRTLWSPVKLSLWTQLILLFLSILKRKEVKHLRPKI